MTDLLETDFEGGPPADGSSVPPSRSWRSTSAIDPSTYLGRPTWRDRTRRSVRTVTSVGWFVVGLTAISWVVGWRLGWDEFMLIATAGLICLAVSVVWIVGGSEVGVVLEVQPQRVTVGERSAGQMTVTNRGRRRQFGLRIDLAVGAGTAEFDVPAVPTGEEHEELFVLPTQRRAVIPVGPATIVRSDPLGLLRRSAKRADPIPLIVHPRIVHLGELGAGLLRDLEGQTTPDFSPSDIAFHAMREYEPGDERRFVHWLTTARVGRLMVRQFNDTRRAHLAIVTDGLPGSYQDDDEFETAISVAGTFGVRGLTDEQEVSASVAGQRVPTISGQALLDGLAAAQQSARQGRLVAQVDELARAVTGISLAVVITGSRPAVADLRAAVARFGVDVRTVVVRVDHHGVTSFRSIGSTPVLTLARLEDLPSLLLAVARS